MQHTLRYNPPNNWRNENGFNPLFTGLIDLCQALRHKLSPSSPLTMLEIGSYKGESTSIFAASGLFSSITCVEPFQGDELALELFKDDWIKVKKEFWTNTRHWDYIHLINDYSYNIYDEGKRYDFIYIDANHDYESIKKEIEMFTPLANKAIGGHDYHHDHQGVFDAVNEKFGTPAYVFEDSSWLVYL